MSAKKKPAAAPRPTCVVCHAQLLDNGKCRYYCPPEAAKKHLRAIDKANRERQRRADRGDIGGYLTPAESSAGVNRAVPERIREAGSLAAQVRGDVRSKGWVKR